MRDIKLTDYDVPDKESHYTEQRAYRVWILDKKYIFPSRQKVELFLKRLSFNYGEILLELNQHMIRFFEHYRNLWMYGIRSKKLPLISKHIFDLIAIMDRLTSRGQYYTYVGANNQKVDEFSNLFIIMTDLLNLLVELSKDNKHNLLSMELEYAQKDIGQLKERFLNEAEKIYRNF